MLEEFYESNIYAPLSARAPEKLTMRGNAPPEPELDNAIPRRVSILDKIPKAPAVEAEATKPMLAIGIGLALIAVGLIAFAVVRHSWPIGIGSAIFLLLVVRALRQWHA
jgi:hypothetical protein